MVDYAAWASVDTLTIWQAAFLWVGMDPALSSVGTATANVPAVVAPRLQMLQGAIAAGELAADSRMNASAAAGNYASSFVQRGDLMKFAEDRGETPAFLFPPSRMKPQAPTPDSALSPDSAVLSKERFNTLFKDSKLLQEAERNARRRMQEAEWNARRLEEALGRAAERVEAQRRARPSEVDLSPAGLSTFAPPGTPRLRIAEASPVSRQQPPDDFVTWAEGEHAAGRIITAGAATRAMASRSPLPGRNELRRWLDSLDPSWVASRGVPPPRE